ncbi:uncharacterized protein TOT_040000180 [Theileria orientalis strain Shintoku]|uniref:Protein phosphatase inhibitor n=1 Tax=Theileria orientalis strain Shintoku TaxID=869250 RepID=J4DQ42_THEOR|nr:uncharacterized protein TOT_040000180 [Theileria orientalis strain Shintoku]BAM41799.1 uncharacterized protein TOT_040000180 [Theileria orientalis strain Shintoku]|eukprot:XP_009692100.1 uncharacterized protein TOT_040000180 [Theileria orientalis strain Shintoku]
MKCNIDKDRSYVATETECNNSQNDDNQTVTEISCRPPDSRNDRSVTWDPDTVDNEHLNRKSSKSCCIFTGKKRCKHNSDIDGMPLYTFILSVDNSDTDSSTSDTDTDPEG